MTLLATVIAAVTFAADSTSYSPCSAGQVMADGSVVRPGSAASNRHPLGTRITILGAEGPGGRREWTIRDRIGWGSSLDLWQPSCAGAIQWGRRAVRYRIGWSEPMARRRGRPALMWHGKVLPA